MASIGSSKGQAMSEFTTAVAALMASGLVASRGEAITLAQVQAKMAGMRVLSVGSTPTAKGLDVVIRLERYTDLGGQG